VKYGLIENPKDYFDNLGNLHDARIEYVGWLPREKKLSIAIDDMNSNFLDLPEYEGLEPAMLVFLNVEHVVFDIEKTDEHLNVYEFNVETKPSHIEVNLKYWPSGKLIVNCKSIELQNNKDFIRSLK